MRTARKIRQESSPEPPSIREQAAEWLVRWHCGDLNLAERFEYLEWLKVSPVHISETLQLCMLYSVLYGVKPLTPVQYEQSVVPMTAIARSLSSSQSRLRVGNHSRAYVRGLTAFAAMISVGMGTLNMAWIALQEANPVIEDLFRALPLLAAATPVLVSILALIVGAAVGLRAVRRGAKQ